MLNHTLTGSIKPGTEVKILVEVAYNVEKDGDGKVVASTQIGPKEILTTTTK